LNEEIILMERFIETLRTGILSGVISWEGVLLYIVYESNQMYN
jgi:hypothetical protein